MLVPRAEYLHLERALFLSKSRNRRRVLRSRAAAHRRRRGMVGNSRRSAGSSERERGFGNVPSRRAAPDPPKPHPPTSLIHLKHHLIRRREETAQSHRLICAIWPGEGSKQTARPFQRARGTHRQKQPVHTVRKRVIGQETVAAGTRVGSVGGEGVCCFSE